MIITFSILVVLIYFIFNFVYSGNEDIKLSFKIILVVISASFLVGFAFFNFLKLSETKTNENDPTLFNNLFIYLSDIFNLDKSHLLSIDQLIDDIKSSTKEKVNSLRLYLALREKVHKNTEKSIDLITKGTLLYLLDEIKDLSYEDMRKSVVFEIFNDILYIKDSKNFIDSDEVTLKQLINISLDITKDWLLLKVNLLKNEEEACLKKIEELNITDSFEAYTELEEAKKRDRLKVCKACEDTNGYKCIVTIGLLATDNVLAQTYICDRGGIDIILDSLSLYNDSPIISKWCIWTCINVIYEHPPNKREFYIKNGIPAVLKAMKTHRSSVEVNQQGFALLFCILNDDPYTKINLHLARNQALSNGLTDVSYHATRTFEKNKLITSTIDGLSKIIYKDWIH